jgi:ketosteroid isomerase-like protein
VLREPVELVRSGVEAFNRRDFDAALAIGDDSLTWRPVFALEDALLEGKAAIRAAWSSQVDALDLHIEPEELIPVGGETVVMVARFTGVGRTGGTPINAMRAQVYKFEDGRIVAVESFATKAEAVEAARRTG